MKFLRFRVWVISLFTLCSPLRAQFYSTGEAPASLHWMQIQSPGFTVVFPKGSRQQAFRLLDDLRKTRMLTESPYSKPARTIPILMQTSSTLSNGYVTWTPRRMEIVTTPPQDGYAQDWIDQLALHEYRHVVQISQYYQGFTRGLSWLTGEIGPGMVTAEMPRWFYEGDAVRNETIHSLNGRGRMGGFEMPLRAIVLDQSRKYSYDEAILGSYRKYSPGIYPYGYEMVSYADTRYGSAIWPNAMNYAARHPYLISPLAVFLLRHYHLTKARLYRKTIDSLKYQFTRKEQSITWRNYSPINRRIGKLYAGYQFPHEVVPGKYVVFKRGLDQPDAFVLLDSTGREKRISMPGFTLGLKMDVYGEKVVWDEIARDPRWDQRNYSELRLLDLHTGRIRNLTRKTRYFSPDFSADGKTLVVVENETGGNNFLSFLDAETGKNIRRIPAPENMALQFPDWLDMDRVNVITVSAAGKQIMQYDLQSGIWRTLMPVTAYNLSELSHFRQYVLFRCDYSGCDNLFALDPRTNTLFQITFSRYGAANPAVSPDSTRLLFSDYTAKGYNATKIPLDPHTWEIIHPGTQPSGIWPGTEATTHQPLNDTVTGTYPVVPYRKYTHLFHVHSWLPFYTDISGTVPKLDQQPIDIGFMLFSQNLLSTFISSIGYQYNAGYSSVNPHFIWRGWYPVLDLSGRFGGPVSTYPLPEGVSLPSGGLPYYEADLKAYIPLVYYRNKVISVLEPLAEYQYASTYYYNNSHLQQGINYISLKLYMSRYRQLSLRDLYPVWGGYATGTWTTTPNDGGLLGSLFSVQGGIYLPGILRHQSLLLKGGYQKQYTHLYYMGINRIDFPRGFSSAVSGELAGFSVDYALPLVYPDLSLGSLLYLKRIRADIFHDWSYGKDVVESSANRYTGAYRSEGLEMMFDFHLFRFYFPVAAGVRLGYKENNKQYFSEFLLNISTNAL